MVGKSKQQELEAASHLMPIIQKQRSKYTWFLVFSSLSSFYVVRDTNGTAHGDSKFPAQLM